jgi:hypothetical protein
MKCIEKSGAGTTAHSCLKSLTSIRKAMIGRGESKCAKAMPSASNRAEVLQRPRRKYPCDVNVWESAIDEGTFRQNQSNIDEPPERHATRIMFVGRSFETRNSMVTVFSKESKERKSNVPPVVEKVAGM